MVLAPAEHIEDMALEEGHDIEGLIDPHFPLPDDDPTLDNLPRTLERIHKELSNGRSHVILSGIIMGVQEIKTITREIQALKESIVELRDKGWAQYNTILKSTKA